MSAVALVPPPGRFDDVDDMPDDVLCAIDGPTSGALPADRSTGDVFGRDHSPPPPKPAPWLERVASCEAEWFTKAPPRRDYLLRDTRSGNGAIVRGKTAMLLAQGGLGKTTTIAHLLASLSTGTQFLGCYQPAEAVRTFGAFGEEDLPELRRKTYHAVRSARLTVKDPSAIVMLPLAGMTCAMVESDDRGNAVDAPFFVWLRGWLRVEVAARGPFGLLAFDPLSRFAGPNAEIDNAAATRFVQALESLVEPAGNATVLVAHHTTKTSRGNGATVDGSSARGSSAFYDGVRWAAALSSERVQCDDAASGAHLGELVTFSVVKSNYSPKGDPVVLRRDLENGGALIPLDSMDLEMVAAARRDAEPSTRRRAQRDEQGRERTTTVASAVLAALRANPEGLTYRGLRGAVVAAIGGCSDPILVAALSSLDRAVAKRPGPRGSTVHCLGEVTP